MFTCCTMFLSSIIHNRQKVTIELTQVSVERSTGKQNNLWKRNSNTDHTQIDYEDIMLTVITIHKRQNDSTSRVPLRMRFKPDRK